MHNITNQKKKHITIPIDAEQTYDKNLTSIHGENFPEIFFNVIRAFTKKSHDILKWLKGECFSPKSR